MSDIHLRFGNEATRAQNNSISGFPRFWDEEVIKHSRRSLTLSLSRQRQVSRRHRPTWSVPDVKVARVLGRYAEQKNPGLATDEDLQAVEARLSEPTAAQLTTPTARSPASSNNESLIVHGGESPFGRPQGDWARGIKVDPDAPPGYSDPNYVYSGGDSSAGPAELPGHSTADWRLTPAELEEDPFPHIRPDNDPFGPSLSAGASHLQIPVSPSRWSSSHGSSRTRYSNASGRSTQSVRMSDSSLHFSGRPKGHAGRKSTGTVRESPDMYGPG